MGRARRADAVTALTRVLETLIDATLCAPCIEVLTELATADVEASLHRLTALATIAAISGVRDRCHRLTEAFRLNRLGPYRPPDR